MITATIVRRRFLEPAMDARALNLEQARLIFDPSPEPDSLLEALRVLEATIGNRQARELRVLASLARRFGQLNAREGRHEIVVTAAADRLVRDLRDLELNGAGEAVLASKAIARALREPLQVLGSPPEAEALAFVAAARAIDEVLRRVPSLQLLSHTVEYELGEGKFALLRALVESRSEKHDAAGKGGVITHRCHCEQTQST